MTMQLSCPKCSSVAFKRNGYTRHGKQNHRCLDCGRQFSIEPPEPFPHTSQSQYVAHVLGDTVKKNTNQS